MGAYQGHYDILKVCTCDFCHRDAKVRIPNTATAIVIEIKALSKLCTRDSGVSNDFIEAVDSEDATLLVVDYQPVLMNRGILDVFTKYLQIEGTNKLIV